MKTIYTAGSYTWSGFKTHDFELFADAKEFLIVNACMVVDLSLPKEAEEATDCDSCIAVWLFDTGYITKQQEEPPTEAVF